MDDKVLVTYKNMDVGTLWWNESKNIGEFAYFDSFIHSGIELSPLLMPLSKKIYSFPDYDRETYKGLPPLISDSLPDKFGNILMISYLNSLNVDINSISKLFHLNYIGKRGAGALEFEPTSSNFSLPSTININEIKQIINDIYSIKTNKFSYNENQQNHFNFLMNFGTSVGGARAKMFIGIDEINKIITSGDLPTQKGLNYYLLKISNELESSNTESHQFGNIEYVYYKMAKDIGINIMDSYLWNQQHFYTKRFDRDTLGNKIHYQTFNSFFGADFKDVGKYSYEDFFSALNKLNLPHSDINEFFKRMCFNVISMNRDDHTKNFSLIMNETNIWRLAPAYDLCFSYNPSSKWTSRHNLKINNKQENITNNDLLKIGETFFIKNPQEIIDTIKDVVSNFKTYCNNLNISNKMQNELYNTIHSQPIFNESSNSKIL